MNWLTILQQYGIDAQNCMVTPHGNGLINHTYLVKAPKESFILQQINHQVFTNPPGIHENIQLISNYLQQNNPDYLLPVPITTKEGETLVITDNQNYFRLIPYVEETHAKTVVSSPDEAFEAAAQFGKFTAQLKQFPAQQLHITLPQFHYLPLRVEQFTLALKNGNAERIAHSKDLIEQLLHLTSINNIFLQLISSGTLLQRVTHHDTKISNVLFNNNNKAVCVIDLDTVMPGYFISDVGDMMRTYLCPLSEESTDFNAIEVRPLFYKALVDGYMSEMYNVLTPTERNLCFYAGSFMIYMQALRFLTDYLNNDVYYGAQYPLHNYNRAKNQLVLLQQLIALEKVLQ